MQILPTLIYEDIFKEPRPDIAEIISDIPSSEIIATLSYINSQLYLDDSLKNQERVLKYIFQSQNTTTKTHFFKNYMKFRLKYRDTEISIFSSIYIKSFMHYELKNYRNVEIGKLTPKQVLNFLKAYFIIASIKSAENKIQQCEYTDKNYFYTVYWPLILPQINAQIKIQPFVHIIRATSLLNYLRYHSEYSEITERFLLNKGHNVTLEFCLSLFKLLNYAWEKDKNGDNKYYFKGIEYELFNTIFINQQDYTEDYRNKKENFDGLKSKPLFRVENEDLFFVLDWWFISNIIYESLVFDFFNNSGIKELSKFKNIGDFKNIIGKKITEEKLFKPVLKYILSKSNNTLILPDNDNNGEPDAYFQCGNSIIIFEIKDAFFSKAQINSSYEEIKNVIDEKYNREKKGKKSAKGVAQLIEQIKKITDKSGFYSGLNAETQDIKIYPVLVYADNHFGMHGISNYLINKFNLKLDKANLRSSFNKINDLTFISLDFLISHSKFLKNSNFIDIIESIHNELYQRELLVERNRNNIQFLQKYHENIEIIFGKLYQTKREDDLDQKDIVEIFNLKEGLTK